MVMKEWRPEFEDSAAVGSFAAAELLIFYLTLALLLSA